tara:strand:- start:330 stop:1022 length:693 start_codon:yes stop_codon:yes gene_type:complete
MKIKMIDMKKDIKKILGLSILEALVSTAIIGIGFVAILQMTNYSVQSIYSSGERTKANYLTNLIAEDLVGYENRAGESINFSDFLASDEGKSEINSALDFCNNASAGTSSTNTGNVYGDSTTDGHLMKTRKWEALLNNKSYLNCKGTNERKNIEVFKISSTYSNMKIEDPDNPGTFLDEGMPNSNTRTVNGVEEPYVKDDLMYIGRVQMNLNDGKKRKFLYFQTDYFLKN